MASPSNVPLKVVKLSLIGASELEVGGTVCTGYYVNVLWEYPVEGDARQLITITVVRRFSEFYDLYYSLWAYPSVYNAEFPRRVLFGSTWSSVVEERKQVLSSWLQKLSEDTVACADPKLLEWVDVDKATQLVGERMAEAARCAEATVQAEAESAAAKRELAELKERAAQLQAAFKEATHARDEAEAAAAAARAEMASPPAFVAQSSSSAYFGLRPAADRSEWTTQLADRIRAAGHPVAMPEIDAAVSTCGGDLAKAEADYFELVAGAAAR